MVFNALYVHIPFCVSKCIYCDFISDIAAKEDQKRYLELLCLQITSLPKQLEPLETIYIGGGTPSLIELVSLSNLIAAIRDKFRFSKDLEFTIEVNPESVTEQKLRSYLKWGINRLSIGVQSLDDELLRLLNRKHNAQMALDAIDVAYFAGYVNFSVDMLIGIPNQRFKVYQHNLEALLQYPIRHLSIYQLTREAGTGLDKHYANKTLIAPNDAAFQKMYLYTHERLEQAGFIHYEVSNWAKSGFESRHNSLYWKREPYLGLGVAAHSFDGIRRFSLTRDFQKYLHSAELSYDIDEVLTEDQILLEKLMLGLRTNRGISREFAEKYFPILLEIQQRNPKLFIADDENICLSPEGWLVMDEILSQTVKT